MKTPLTNVMSLALALSIALSAVAEEKSASDAKTIATPRVKDRVYVKDVEGIWMSSAYIEALKATRSPHAAAKKAQPLVITIKRDGVSFPILVTNFRTVALRAVLDIEPFTPPGTFRLVTGPDDRPTSLSDVIYIPFRGSRIAGGTFEKLSVADPLLGKKKWMDYARLDGALNALINRHTIAGSYRDEKGATWEMTEAGDAIWPEENFRFELSLEGSDANCEFMEVEEPSARDEKRRIGFGWRGGTLALFKVTLGRKPLVRCASKPFALLTPTAQ